MFFIKNIACLKIIEFSVEILSRINDFGGEFNEKYVFWGLPSKPLERPRTPSNALERPRTPSNSLERLISVELSEFVLKGN